MKNSKISLIFIGIFTLFSGAQGRADSQIIDTYGSPVRRTTSVLENLDKNKSYALDTIKVLNGTTWEQPSDDLVKKMKSMFKKQSDGRPSLKIPAAFGSTVAFTIRTKGETSEKLPEIYVLHGNTTVDPKKREIYASSKHDKNFPLHVLPTNQEYGIDESTIVAIGDEQPELHMMHSTKKMYLRIPANCPAQPVIIHVLDKVTGKRLPYEGPAYQITVHPVI